MGTIHEFGYREYPDDLTPGKGGESSLLFDRDGNLAGHASFRRLSGDDAGGDSSSSDEVNPVTVALVMLGVTAAVVVVAKGARRAMGALREQWHRASSAGGSPTDVENEGRAAAVASATPNRASDDVDVLIDEVGHLRGETDSRMREYQSRRNTEDDVDRDPDTTASSASKHGAAGIDR